MADQVIAWKDAAGQLHETRDHADFMDAMRHLDRVLRAAENAVDPAQCILRAALRHLFEEHPREMFIAATAACKAFGDGK